MIRHCDSADVKATVFGEEPCGRTYDDAEQSTICPHNPLPPAMTYEELMRVYREAGIETPTPGGDGP